MANLAFASLAICAIELSPSQPFRFKPLNNLRLTNASISVTKNLDWTAVYVEHLDTIQLQSPGSASSRRESCICWLKPGELLKKRSPSLSGTVTEVAKSGMGNSFPSDPYMARLRCPDLTNPYQPQLSLNPIPRNHRSPLQKSERGLNRSMVSTLLKYRQSQIADLDPLAEVSKSRAYTESTAKPSIPAAVAPRKRKRSVDHSEGRTLTGRLDISTPRGAKERVANRLAPTLDSYLSQRYSPLLQERSRSADPEDQPVSKRVRESQVVKPSEPTRMLPKPRQTTRPAQSRPDQPPDAAKSNPTTPKPTLFYPEPPAEDRGSRAKGDEDLEEREDDRNPTPSMSERESVHADQTEQRRSTELASEEEQVDEIEASSIMGIGDYSDAEASVQ
ncbi:hypothetical protein SISNIDRAFT_471088 [Sistotremastrum niveocremeum HHB9708]|uniref:Uncharacterized protein n=1 Tax=Sistotremastrum niveocremeum HHB9708 TaxID=1314777 RepID=A0A164N471_9AGAM|nr:hypothetical protein SISNIDRAFT_471088 [Sistotremastrum niveocremeum HHB9708]